MNRLVGVGVGPGDPELVTVKALRMLREADRVMVPVGAAGEAGRAEEIVAAHTDRELTRLVFGLGNPQRSPAGWRAAADALVDAYAQGARSVAFATIGDPNVYSTFSYLANAARERVADLAVSTIPGITAMQALAAASDTPLVIGTETLTLLPLAGDRTAFRAALAAGGTVVGYKGGAALPELIAELDAAGRLSPAVYGAALGRRQQRICPAADLAGQPGGPYLSALLVPARDRAAAIR